MTKNQNIEKKISELPPSAMSELESYVDYLLTKVKRGAGAKLQQDWAGGAKDFKDQYTSLELQKKALEWRTK